MFKDSLPILYLFVLFVIITIAILFFIKKINITDKRARQIEIMGYFILITLTLWVFVFKNIEMKYVFPDTYYVEEKINTIFYLQKNILNGITDNQTLYDHFSYIDEMAKDSYLLNQKKVVDIIEALLQILSVCCIAIGRFQEMKKKNK